MSFVFLSYSREDASVATRIVSLLEQKGIDVFWDNRIRLGDDHKAIIVDRLESAECVLVLWSKHSASSHWVNYEAQTALDRRSIIEARIDDVKPPPPFGVLNIANLRAGRGRIQTIELRRLVDAIATRIRSIRPVRREFSLAAPLRRQQVTDSHLALLHTCWRTPHYDSAFSGAETYRWDIALYGSKPALDRVASVTYFLHPAYEIPDGNPPSSAVTTVTGRVGRKNCFRLRQIADGHSLVRAHVNIRSQNEPVRLSRYINLFDSSARIDEYKT